MVVSGCELVEKLEKAPKEVVKIMGSHCRYFMRLYSKGSRDFP